MRNMTKLNTWVLTTAVIGAALASTGFVQAQDVAAAAPAVDAGPSAADAMFTVNNLWLLISAALVFIMHLGFATLESGLTQRKNTVNILFKNVFILSTGILTYYIWGFRAHYPGVIEWTDVGATGATWKGITGFFALGSPAAPGDGEQTIAYGNYTYWTDFIFQAMFAATAATIVSGAVAERVQLGKFMIYAILLVGFAYPLAGSWHWGTGILAKFGFYDFAGSTVVHAFGGFSALACVLVLGPRAGKYLKDGSIRPILGHSLPLATIGVFLLWLGWFGFNGGSVLSADAAGVSVVFVTTTLAACAGAVGAMITSALVIKKPDLSMALNGILAGLVGITAGADQISPAMSVVVGLIAGIIVVFAILFFDRIKIDDPVGAISVHGICGIWGTLAVAIFSDAATFKGQIIGILMVCIFAFLFSYVVFSILKKLGGVRVSSEEEHDGLDVAEHGAPAYHA